MKKTIIATIIMSSLITIPLMAKESKTLSEPKSTMSKQTKEEIGFGSGAIIGAVFGGPIGAVVTGIAGHFIAKYGNATEDIAQLNTALITEKKQNSQNLAKLERELSQSQLAYQQELAQLVQQNQQAGQLQAENLLMSLQFKTGSSAIPEYYQEQLNALASILQSSPNLLIDLSGYTDLLGSSEINQQLSLARANSVQESLTALGVDARRINTFGYGDSTPVVANNEQKSSFYDRRVVIKLRPQPSQVAQNF